MAIDQHQTSLGLEETGTDPTADAERDRVRAEYRARLAEKLKDPEFRGIEGFPIGTDEAILALSDPPYYTACPNPFIEEWLAEHAKPYDPATDEYHREPFAADVSEGKNDPIYNSHSYHTKVPHKAIMRYILHYTEPGDVISDGFCGTGMTGVAAQLCGDKGQVESLGYNILQDGTILDEHGAPFSRLGPRTSILSDLSPAATFIAYNYNIPFDAAALQVQAKRILQAVEEQCGWMYSTLHGPSTAEAERIKESLLACKTEDECRALYQDLHSPLSPLRDPRSKMQVGRVNYTVWSDVFRCPSCAGEIVFWDAAVDAVAGRVQDTFTCPSCRAETDKRKCVRVSVTRFDDAVQKSVAQAKQVPVLINYTVGKKRYERVPDPHDIALVDKIESLKSERWFPTEEMPKGYNTEQPRRSHGVTCTHHFYTPRNLIVFSRLWHACEIPHVSCALMGGYTVGLRLSRFLPNRWIAKDTGPMKPLTAGTLYIPSLSAEQNWLNIFSARSEVVARQLKCMPKAVPRLLLGIGSATSQPNVPSDSIAYIFTDPPFGGNLMYSELSFLNESWLKVRTNNTPEAITNDTQGKSVSEYQNLMTRSFGEFYRVLRPGRWMTVEFHNSSNAVWNAIGEALERAGFVVADVRTIDKQQGTFKQVTTTTAVKQDLIISCYKPRREFRDRFHRVQGEPEGVVVFLRQHLAMLPVVPVNKSGRLEPVAERTRFLLFDRMVAYHLQHGARIPVSAAEFYKLLEEQFLERDEMYFLPDQAARYDALKARGMETEQFSLFVRHEKSAVQWVRIRLTEKPQTLGDLTPAFMQELREWPAHEPRPELRDLLREYFIEDGGIWRVPDPDNESDLEALRNATLLKLFREYVSAKGPLKTFRTEAVLEGFRYCWETKQYGVVVQVCEKIPAKVLQEVHDLVQFYDIAKDLAPERVEQLEFTWE